MREGEPVRVYLLRCALFFALGALALTFGTPVTLPALVRISGFVNRGPLVTAWTLLAVIQLASALWDQRQVRLVAMSLKLGFMVFWFGLSIAGAVFASGSWLIVLCFAWVLLDMFAAIRYYALTAAQEAAIREAMRRIREERRGAEHALSAHDPD